MASTNIDFKQLAAEISGHAPAQQPTASVNSEPGRVVERAFSAGVVAPAIPQPDANGEFSRPVDGALWMANFGIPQIPLNGKIPYISDWPNQATCDHRQIEAWAEQFPGCNFGSVARNHEFFMFETDSVDVKSRFEKTGEKFTSRLVIESRKGRGHRYYRWATGVTNISQSEGGTLYKDFSLRANNQQCVSPGSIHRLTGRQYRVIRSGAPETPTRDEINFWNSERLEAKKKTIESEQLPIISGSRNVTLTRIAGKMRREFGWDADKMFDELSEINANRCEPPLDSSEVQTIANSIARYQDGITQQIKETPLVGGRPASSVSVGEVPVAQTVLPEIDQTSLSPRPVFPLWAIKETSLYEGFVRPVVESSSKNPEFLWLSAAQIMMNYFSDRVRIENQTINWNLFLGLVSDPGKYFKSSSCQLAQKYFKYAGLLEIYTPSLRNSEGKVIVLQAGSSEGFGLDMQKINAKHAIMFNSELGKLVAKAGIENSSMPNDILDWYDRNYFGNSTSNEKKKFSFPADSYIFGMCWCTTTQGFNRHWPKLAGIVSGMEDRMFFCIGPEKPRSVGPMWDAPIQDGALKTRELIDRAVQTGAYRYEDVHEAQQMMLHWEDPRSRGLVEKFSLLLAIDLGRTFIDSECIERADAIVSFRQAVTAYLAPIEADNQQGRLQQEMLRELRKNCGKITYRGLCRNLNHVRHGMDFWRRAYRTLIDEGEMVEFLEPGGHGQKRKMVGLPRRESEE
jgi:hypothetical protein